MSSNYHRKVMLMVEAIVFETDNNQIKLMGVTDIV
jgi:hypothetical protein